MALTPGTRFGPYEIADAIGAGGMGEVYRATDNNLKRDVAIKVLPESLANDEDRLARFQREAEVLASLNHTNIAQIFGLEKGEGGHALVMELVEGPTLADRIAQGAIPADEALNIAMQIAEGLEAAHAQNIIHRDLKPANIKVRPDGTVKVLDFGIAKALENPVTGSMPESPQLTTPAMTQAGIVLGTAAYMSPEQARGKAVDKRADVWAFGCVLYEMLTGQQAFGGEDVATTLARVIANDTNMNSLPSTIAPTVRHTIALCLQKDVTKRIRDIGDVKLALEGTFETEAAAVASSDSAAVFSARRFLPLAAALFVGALLVGVAVWQVWPESPPTPLSRFSYVLPDDQRFQGANASILDVAPNGRSFAYNAIDGVYLRRLADLEARLIPGTEGGRRSPTFSPDGQSLAYFSTLGQLQRMSVTGGAPVVLADWGARVSPGATWGEDGAILYNEPAGIYRVPETGGAPELIVEASEEQFYRPQLLPGGDKLLFSVRQSGTDWNTGQVVVESLPTGERTVVINGGVDGRYLPTGHVVYAFEDGLYGVAFDIDTLSVSGVVVPLLQGVQRASGNNAAANFAVSNDGTLVYRKGGASSAASQSLVWVDRDGREEPVGLESRTFSYVRVSPDGNRIAAVDNVGGRNIWVSDVTRPVLSHTTNTITQPGSLTWSADSRRVIYTTAGDSGRNLSWTLADGTGDVETLLSMENVPFVSAGGRTPDGGGIVFTYGSGSAQPQIGLLSIDANNAGPPDWRPLIDRATGASAASISPTGEWIAYHTDDTGQYGVYIERFPELGDRRLVSEAQGGWGARWSPDGSELFYRRLDDGAMMAVQVQTSPVRQIGAPEFLFNTETYFPLTTPSAGGGSAVNWDLAPDGRFLMIKMDGIATGDREIIVVQNWFEELKRLVPTE